jgi:tetratricopeptide (TPR) repeat protein
MFELTFANALPVAAICAHLDGLPLAIELAASRSKLLSPQALLTRLVHRFRLLTGGAHDLPSRHQTLKNALDWSYELLGSDQQRVFEWLAVFIGGWRLEAAEYVAGELGRDGSGESLPPQSSQLASSRTSLLDAQATLLDQSLLLREITADGEQRLMMLETIREYALERLTERDEVVAAQQQHTRYFLYLAETAEPELIGPDQSTWFARLEEEHDNLRTALHWAHQAGATEWGLRLASALWRFWYEHGHLIEGRRWLEQALTTSATPEAEGDRATSRAKALNGLGVIAWRQGDTEQAMALLEASLALHEQLGDKPGIAQTLSNLGILAGERGEYERASSLYEQSLVLNRALSNDWGVAAALLNLGNLAVEQGEYERAVALHEEGLALNRQINDAVGIALSLNNLGVALMMQGNDERAAPLYEESLALQRVLGDKPGMAYALTNLGNVARKQGDGRRATVLFGESLVLSQAMGNKLCMAESLAGLATVACTQAPRSVGARRAARLCGVVAALRVAINAPLSPADQFEFDATLSLAQQELGKELCASAWAEGQAMAMEQAIAYALDAGISEPFPGSSDDHTATLSAV